MKQTSEQSNGKRCMAGEAYTPSAAAPPGNPAAALVDSPANAPPPAFPAGVPPPPSRGEPSWRAPNAGVYPDLGAPTAANAHASAGQPPRHREAYPTAPAPAQAVNGHRQPAPVVQRSGDSGSSVSDEARAAHEPIPSAPLYVPAPNRVSPASSVPREDLWYTSDPLPQGRPFPDGEPIRYPTVGEVTMPGGAGGDAGERLDDALTVEMSRVEVSGVSEVRAPASDAAGLLACRDPRSANCCNDVRQGALGQPGRQHHRGQGLAHLSSRTRSRCRTELGSAVRARQVKLAEEEHVVPEVSGWEHAARTADSYPNVGTSGTGTAPRERLREKVASERVEASGGSGSSSGYPNVGSTGLGTATRERVYVR